jgi:hypothetical protein
MAVERDPRHCWGNESDENQRGVLIAEVTSGPAEEAGLLGSDDQQPLTGRLAVAMIISADGLPIVLNGRSDCLSQPRQIRVESYLGHLVGW